MNIGRQVAIFKAGIQETNRHLIEVGRKLDQMIELLKILVDMQAGDGETGGSYTVTIPPDWISGSDPGDTDNLEEME